jgi:hypothetical protein
MKMSSSQQPIDIKINTRRYKVKKTEGYNVPSRGLIRSWKMIDDKCKFIPILYINGIPIRTPRSDKNLLSISEIRNYIRNLEYIESKYEHDLDLLEQLFFNNQLYGIEYYKTLTNKDLSESLFTRDLKKLQISFGSNGPEEVEIEEEFWDRKGEDIITQTEEDLEMLEEIKSLQPMDQKMIRLT